MASANDILTTVNQNPTKVTPPRVASRRQMKKMLRPRVVIRLLGICCLGCLTGFLIFDTPYWMAAIWTAAATVALFYETVRFLDQSERKLTAFLQAFNQNDFSLAF